MAGMLGVGGIGGAIDRWTSPVAAIVLLIISAITGYAAYRESGERRKNKVEHPNKKAHT
jgi:hypothetical protein